MTAPLIPPSSIDKVATLASSWAIQVEVNGNWEWLIGATSFDLQTPKTLQNAGDLDFGQWGGQVATEVNWTMSMNLLKKLSQSGEVDEATKHLLACSVKTGVDGMTKVRCWRTDGFPDAWEGKGDVQTGGGGGDKTALNSTTLTITGYGPLEPITKPSAAFVTKTFTVTGAPAGGKWTVTVDGETTNELARTVTEAQLQSALEALPNIGEGNVTVTGTATDGLVAVFNTAVTTVTAAHTFTGGTSPDVTVA